MDSHWQPPDQPSVHYIFCTQWLPEVSVTRMTAVVTCHENKASQCPSRNSPQLSALASHLTFVFQIPHFPPVCESPHWNSLCPSSWIWEWFLKHKLTLWVITWVTEQLFCETIPKISVRRRLVQFHFHWTTSQNRHFVINVKWHTNMLSAL